MAALIENVFREEGGDREVPGCSVAWKQDENRGTCFRGTCFLHNFQVGGVLGGLFFQYCVVYGAFVGGVCVPPHPPSPGIGRGLYYYFFFSFLSAPSR